MSTAGPSSYNFADIWESIVGAVPDRTAVVSRAQRRTFAELDERADRLAGWMAHRGVRRDDFVGLALRNGPAYIEASLAAYKLRAVPVNVNYRLRADELHYLIQDGGLVGVVHDPDVGEPLAAAAEGCPTLRWTLSTGEAFEDAASSTSPVDAPIGGRSGDDLYVLYTGGTTGKPKGVVWRMEDAFFACVGGGDPTGDRGPVQCPEQLVERIREPVGFLPVAPLVHAAGMWTTLRWLFAGSKVVLLPDFDPAAIWSAVVAEKVEYMNIVGDAMARPLLEAAHTVDGQPPLRVLGSGGAALSAEVKTGWLQRIPDLTIKDTFGSSETGVQGWSVHQRGTGSQARFRTVDTVVLEPNTLREPTCTATEPGIIARVGRVPLRYHGDPARSAATFPERGGRRYALTGDLGRVEADGTVTVLGRGSQCINTGGEKVFAEEVEAVLLQHTEVHDALVVGIPDPRWGQAVVALVAPADGTPDTEDVRGHCRDRLAGFKVPKRVVPVTEIRRSPAGKPDYVWARAVAAQHVPETEPETEPESQPETEPTGAAAR